MFMRYVILGLCILGYLLLGYEAIKYAWNTDPKKEQGSGSIMFKVITALAVAVGIIYVMATYVTPFYNLVIVCVSIYITWTAFAISELINIKKHKKLTVTIKIWMA